MRKRPDVLKSNESIKVDEIFDFVSKKEMIHYLIDRKVNSLSYGGMKKIEEYMNNFLGIEMFLNEEDRKMMQIFIEIRNALVHNRGYVNRIFMSRIPKNTGFKFELGESVHTTIENLIVLSNVCVKNAINLDNKLSEKFDLKRIKFETWEIRQNKLDSGLAT